MHIKKLFFIHSILLSSILFSSDKGVLQPLNKNMPRRLVLDQCKTRNVIGHLVFGDAITMILVPVVKQRNDIFPDFENKQIIPTNTTQNLEYYHEDGRPKVRLKTNAQNSDPAKHFTVTAGK